MPHSAKPYAKRLSCTVKYSTRRCRSLCSALPAMAQSPLCLPEDRAATTRARKTLGPTQFAQIGKARLFCLEPNLEFFLRFGIILHTGAYYMLWSLESTRYPQKIYLPALAIKPPTGSMSDKPRVVENLDHPGK